MAKKRKVHCVEFKAKVAQLSSRYGRRDTGLNATKTEVVAPLCDCTQSLSSGSLIAPASLSTAKVRRKCRLQPLRWD